MISHIYPSKVDNVYGSFVHSQVLALQNMGCSIKVMAPMAMAPFPLYLLRDKWRNFHDTPKHDIFQGVDVTYPRIIRTPGAGLFELSGLNYYYALKESVLAQHSQQAFDLIHAQVAYPDGWAAARLAEDLSLPLVLTIHGQELQKIVNWSNRLRSMVMTTMEKAAAIVVPSSKMQDMVRKHGDHNTFLIYNGLDSLPMAALPQGIKGQIAGKRVLLSVSRLEPEKGIRYNLEALNLIKGKHPDLVYVILGNGSQRTELQQLTRALGIQNKVIFAGHQPREKVKGFYENSHVFSMPSRDESFGIVYLEAMAAGLPVIGTQGEGIASLLSENDVGRLVKYGDVESLAQQISELLDPHTAEQLGARGRALAAQYTWQRNAQEMLKVYNSLILP